MNRIQFGLLLLIGFLLTASSALSQDDSEFQEWQRQHLESFQKYSEDNAAQFAAYVAEVERKWGEYQPSTRQAWISYSPDLETRSSVDFAEGVVEVVALVPRHDPQAQAKAEQKIASQIEELGREQDETGELLEQQLSDSSGNAVAAAELPVYARQAATRAESTGEVIKGSDGVERLKVKVTLQLVPDHLAKRAERYLPAVRAQCERHNLDLAMVLALIQTESYFNPRARSSVPAFGLMQLVPASGGREAWRYIFAEDHEPKPSYLYDPEQNVELGTGLLAKLRNTEFAGVENSQNALLCIICAYNTGPGNVARALTGKRQVAEAVAVINSLTPDKLLARLVRDLPYAETRDYIKKVKERTANYTAWR